MSPEPQRLEDKLRCLSLAPTALDRDTLLFEAGRRSAKPARGWKFASLASCLIAVGTMSLHFLTPVERIVYVTAPLSAPPQELVAMQPAEPTTEARPESAWSLFQLRQQAIQQTSFVPAVMPAEDKPLQPLTIGSSLTLFPAP